MGYFDIQALPTDKGQHSVDLLNYRGHPFQLPKKFLAAYCTLALTVSKSKYKELKACVWLDNL